MSHFLFEDDSEADHNLDIDELFEKRQQRDLKQLSIYNKILNRIHSRIKRISRAKSDNTCFTMYLSSYLVNNVTIIKIVRVI